jgi:hypothetical protein
MVAAVIIRPRLWPTSIKAVFELAPDHWWRRRPYLPVPDPDWLHFRVVTAYGGDGSLPMRSEELIAWLEWKRTT